MSIRLIRTLPAKFLFFMLVILLEPHPSMGGLFDDEERRREGAARPLTVLQSLVVDFRRVVEGIDEILYCPDTPSRIQAFVLTFMREQAFSISSEQTGPASGGFVRREVIYNRQKDYECSINMDFSSVSAHAALMNSSKFSDILDDSAYVLLLQGWQLKLDPEFPYTNFLPGASHKTGMMVLAPHPLDVSATYEFLSLLYDALHRLQGISPEICVPDHEGLRNIFGVFLRHHHNKEEVLNLWGAFLLGEIEKFYREQRVLVGWEYTARALKGAKDETTQSLHDAHIRLSHAVEEMERLENEYSAPSAESITSTSKSMRVSSDMMEIIFQAWQAMLLTRIKKTDYPPEENSRYGLLQREREMIQAVEGTRFALREYRALKAEVSQLEAAFAMAQYFSSRSGIQFVNPFQVKRDLRVLHAKFSLLPPSKSPSLLPLYRVLGELLSFTFSQVEDLSEDLNGLSKRLPPLALVPESLKEDLMRAYRQERVGLLDISPFAQERKATQEVATNFKTKKLIPLEERILEHALAQVDTSDKEMFISLREESETRALTTEERKKARTLMRNIVQRELELHGLTPQHIASLNHQYRADIAKLAHKKFVLRHQRASLGLEYEIRRFLLWAMTKSNVAAEKITPIHEEIQRLQDAQKEAETNIQKIKERAGEVMAIYEKKMQGVFVTRVPG